MTLSQALLARLSDRIEGGPGFGLAIFAEGRMVQGA